MTTQSKPPTNVFYYSKFIGLTLTVIGIPTMILDRSSGSEIPLLVGLFILLVTTGKIEDERSVHIKTTSLYFAFIMAYAAKLITSNLYSHSLISFELIDINHFLILTLILANAIFYGRVYILKQ